VPANLAPAKYSHSVIGSFTHVGWQLIQLPAGKTVAQALSQYAADPEVLAVEPNGVMFSTPEPVSPIKDRGMGKKDLVPQFPDDALFPQQWGLTKIDAPYAWGITTGNTNVIVAVLDTGVIYTDPDLAPNMWHNPAEIPGNGIDDDGDGWVD